MTLHLENSVQFCGLQHKKDVALLGEVLKRAMKIRIRGLEYTSYEEERLRVVGLFSLENRRLQKDLIVTFQYVKRTYKNHRGRLYQGL